MKFKILNKLALIVFMCFFTVGTSFAAFPPDAIDLEGNVVDAGGNDWQSVNVGAGGAAVYTGIKEDPAPLTIFVGGGSKDHNDPSKWKYKSGGGFPDKNDIVNGYAAAYFLNNGASDDLVLYFGAERFANNGDAFFGFWLFQDQVGIDGSGGFNGHHQEHDLFVLLDYPQGTGSVPFVQVMEWVDSGGDIDNNLQLLYDSGDSGAKCGTGSDAGYACAITNDDPELAGTSNGLWDYFFKGTGSSNTYPPETLFEGRVNVTQVLLMAGVTEIPCFSSFMIETRASRSIDAKLWDFVGGEFPLCSIEVTKTCSASALTAANNFTIDYSINVKNTGVGSIPANEVITIDDTPSNGTEFQLMDTVANYDDDANGWIPDETITITGSYESSVNGGSNTVNAQVSLGAGSIVATEYMTGCDSLQLTPMLTIEKNCAVSLDDTGTFVTLRKGYDVKVCNTGDAPLDVTLTDDVDTSLNEMFSLDFSVGCLVDTDCDTGNSCNSDLLCENIEGLLEGNFGGSVCEVRTGSYLLSTIPSGTLGMTTNTATAKATSSVVDTGPLATVGQSDTATCDLCPLTVEEEP